MWTPPPQVVHLLGGRRDGGLHDLVAAVDEKMLLHALVQEHVELAVAAVHGLRDPLVVRDDSELAWVDAVVLVGEGAPLR
eukprot:1533627-Prymnesium_polylepis.1